MKGLNKKKVLWIGILAVVVLLVISLWIWGKKGKGDKGIPVKTVGMVKQDIESHIQTSGGVLSLDRRQIMSVGGGKLDEILVKEGDAVTSGQILAKLDGSEIEYSIKEAQIRLAIEEERLHFLEQEDRIDLEIGLKDAEIMYGEAKDVYEQTKSLFESGAVSQSEFDQAERNLQKMENQYTLTRRKLDKKQNDSEQTIQKKQIELARITQEKLLKDLEEYTIESPMDGTIVDGVVDPGKIISAGEVLFTMEDTNRLEIETNVSEYDVHKISIGDPVKITGDAIEGKTYEGAVKYIGPVAKSIDTGQGKETVVDLKIGVPEGKTDLKPGFSANVDILTAKKKNVWVIPYEAIFVKKNGEKIIYTVKDGKAWSKSIKTGIEGDLVVEIMGDGIKEGDRIILNPTEKIKDGENVMDSEGMEDDKDRLSE